jgi:hypothetical protein
MKFSKRQDIEAPASAVFAAVSDFGGFERAAKRRGISVERQGDAAAEGPGMQWKIVAPIRGRVREIDLSLVTLQPESDLRLTGHSGGIDAEIAIEVMPLSRTRSRLQIGIDLRASTIPARVLLQSAKLGKGVLDRRFGARIAEFAAGIEARQRKADRTA